MTTINSGLVMLLCQDKQSAQETLSNVRVKITWRRLGGGTEVSCSPAAQQPSLGLLVSRSRASHSLGVLYIVDYHYLV